MLQVPAALRVFPTRPIMAGVSGMAAQDVRSYLSSKHWKKRTIGSKRFWQSLNWISLILPHCSGPPVQLGNGGSEDHHLVVPSRNSYLSIALCNKQILFRAGLIGHTSSGNDTLLQSHPAMLTHHFRQELGAYTSLHLSHNIGVTRNTVHYQDISLLVVKLHNLHSSIVNLLSTPHTSVQLGWLATLFPQSLLRTPYSNQTRLQLICVEQLAEPVFARLCCACAMAWDCNASMRESLPTDCWSNSTVFCALWPSTSPAVSSSSCCSISSLYLAN